MVEQSDLISYLERQISSTQERLQANTIDSKGRKFHERFIQIRIRKYIREFLVGKNIENRWIVIPGFRGTGKTTLLSQLYLGLLNRGIPKDRILYISLDEVTKLLQSNLYEIMNTYEDIRGETIEMIKDKTFLFVDEAQYDKNCDMTLKSIFDKSKNVFIIVTGSSSLSLQTNVDSARRKLIEKLFPLTFIEYMKLKYGILPIGGLKSMIENAIFESDNARRAYESLKSLKKSSSNYWAKVDPYEFEKYLTKGTLPFSLTLDKNYEIYERLLEVLEKVIYDDIPNVDNYDKTTLDKIWNLLLVISDSEAISLESIGHQIELEKPTVFKVLNTLAKAELIFPVKSYGTTIKQTTKSPKYPFTAPIIKACLLWKMGRLYPNSDTYGKLLQDLVALYLYKMSNIKSYFNILHDSGKMGSDFVVKDTRDNTNIVIEVGYGLNKNGNQVLNTINKFKAKYGIVISKKDLKIEDNVVFIPHKLFFLL